MIIMMSTRKSNQVYPNTIPFIITTLTITNNICNKVPLGNSSPHFVTRSEMSWGQLTLVNLSNVSSRQSHWHGFSLVFIIVSDLYSFPRCTIGSLRSWSQITVTGGQYYMEMFWNMSRKPWWLAQYRQCLSMYVWTRREILTRAVLPC